MSARVALITTTINVPHVLTQWVETGMTEDDIIIVAGDYKSPHDEIDDLLNEISMRTGIAATYIHPANQTHWAVSSHLGWNCIQRRNIALLEAMMLKPKYILTIDDDNRPTSTRQVEQLIEIMEGQGNTAVTSTNTGWYNPGRHCLTNDFRNVVHRGYPLSQRHAKPMYVHEWSPLKIGVAAMLWTGDPDIDAIERIVNRPNVARIDGNVILAPGTWAPFNTQATMFLGELAPAMFMWPHVGRYDDIWASYVYRKVADKRGYGAYYGRPAVHQDRNEHDLIKDLDAEMFGMRHNEDVIGIIRGVTLGDEANVMQDVYHVYEHLAALGPFLPTNTVHAMDAWIADLEAING